MTSPERRINNFQEAVIEQDADKLAGRYYHGPDDEIKADDFEGFLAYLEEKRKHHRKLMNHYKNNMNG